MTILSGSLRENARILPRGCGKRSVTSAPPDRWIGSTARTIPFRSSSRRMPWASTPPGTTTRRACFPSSWIDHSRGPAVSRTTRVYVGWVPTRSWVIVASAAEEPPLARAAQACWAMQNVHSPTRTAPRHPGRYLNFLPTRQDFIPCFPRGFATLCNTFLAWLSSKPLNSRHLHTCGVHLADMGCLCSEHPRHSSSLRWPKTRRPHARRREAFGKYPGGDLLSHPVAQAVSSALEGLTSVFGMGTGVSPPL